MNSTAIYNERHMKKWGVAFDWANNCKIERIGGEDHNPKYKGKLVTRNITVEHEGYMSKKEFKKMLVTLFFQEYEEKHGCKY